jgi:hypothetical protein
MPEMVCARSRVKASGLAIGDQIADHAEPLDTFRRNRLRGDTVSLTMRRSAAFMKADMLLTL